MRKIVSILAFSLLGLISIILFNTITSDYQLPFSESARSQGADIPIDRQQALSNLSAALQIKTVSSMADKQPLSSSFKLFHQLLNQRYPQISKQLRRSVINQGSLVYHWPGSDSSLKPNLLLAHIDVVPAAQDTLARWQYPPFSGTVTDSHIWGRGALDVKSTIMASLEAIESLLAQGFKPQRSLYLAFGHDEEIGGQQGAVKIAQYFKQQNLSFEYILDEGGSILQDGVIPGLDTPVAVIGIAEKGYVSLKLAIDAIGGHSSMPPKHTAVGLISQAIVKLENNPLPVDMQFSATLFRRIGPKMPWLKRAIFSNMWLTKPLLINLLSKSPTTNATIRTTTAVTMVEGSDKDNVLPNTASAIVNFRIMPNQQLEDIVQHVTTVIENPDITISPLSDFQLGSQISPVDSNAFKLIATTIAQVERHPDLVVSPYLVVGATDARHYAGLSDNIYRFVFNRYTPASLTQMHGLNERVAIKDYLDSIKFYQNLIINSQLSTN